tara:strand:- start:303 stop:2408 length:2106 start_codon:yes stop_codon:yes gene_type:complete
MAKRRSIRRSKSTFKPTIYFSGEIIGMVIADSTDDVISKNDPLDTIPTVVFYNSNTEVIFDYSHASDHDLETLKIFFGKMSTGDSFTIDSETASFIKERGAKVESDLSGSFTLISFNGNTVTANVTSVTNKDSKTEVYESKYFTTVPRLSTTNASVESKSLFEIRNQTGPDSKYSFRNARPILRGDLLEINTTLNKGRFEVDSYKVENGVEIITLNNRLEEEDLMGTVTPVRLYRNGYSENQLDKTTLREVRSLRRQNNSNGGRGTCCLYLKENQRIEDDETGNVFTQNEVYSCGCKDDWECISLARSMNMDYLFNYQSRNFCDERYDSSCSGFATFPDSPDDDSNVRCACCPPRSTTSILPDETSRTVVSDPTTINTPEALTARPQNVIVDGLGDRLEVRNIQSAAVSNSQIEVPLERNYERDLDRTIDVTIENGEIVLSSKPVLVAGRTYRFNQSHPSNRGVYIAFKKTVDSLARGVQNYTNRILIGTPGTPGAYTFLKINKGDANSTLYYYNSADRNMGGELQVGNYSPRVYELTPPKKSARRSVTTDTPTTTEYSYPKPPNQFNISVGAVQEKTEFNIVVRKEDGSESKAVEDQIAAAGNLFQVTIPTKPECNIILSGCRADFTDNEDGSPYSAIPYNGPVPDNNGGDCLDLRAIGQEAGKCPKGSSPTKGQTANIFVVRHNDTGKLYRIKGPCCYR